MFVTLVLSRPALSVPEDESVTNHQLTTLQLPAQPMKVAIIDSQPKLFGPFN